MRESLSSYLHTDFDPADCAEKLYQTFGPQSKYHREDTGRISSYHLLQYFTM